jgi:hypothetical protein
VNYSGFATLVNLGSFSVKKKEAAGEAHYLIRDPIVYVTALVIPNYPYSSFSKCPA